MHDAKFLFVPALIALLCVMPGCREDKIIKIASHSPLTGEKAPSGLGVMRGAKLACEQLATPLTELGFTIEFVSYDDQAKPDTGVANAKVIVADPGILAVVGHQNSGVHIPSSEVYHGAQLASISPSTTNPMVTERDYPEVNRICGRDDVQGAVGAQFARGRGIRSAYVLHNQTLYGQGIAE